MIGSYGILTTPFDKKGNVNYEELYRITSELSESCIDGIVLNGSTSEFVFLTKDEMIEMMKTVKQAVGDKKPLICGATAPDKATCIQYLNEIDKLGYNGSLIAPPYYYKYTQEEIFDFYKEINKCSKNIYVYNIPFFTAEVPLSIFPKLLELENLVGLKNSGQNMKEMIHQVDLKNKIRTDFRVLTGTEDIILPCLVVGIDGSFTALAALLPQVINSIYTHFEQNDYQNALKIQQAILPLIRICDSFTFPIGYKFLAEVLGMKNEYYKQSVLVSEGRIIKIKELMQTELDKIYSVMV